ncbi:MAG: AAA family ATPase [Treponema sp.]|nr:AAA family ATPase [Candidatus Treponema equi]
MSDDVLFHSANNSHEPLASRMRPRSLDEYIGQNHIVGKGRLLRRAIQADQLTSVIFYGPPGTGKTTLARVIANHTSSHFITLNAVLTGVANIRDAIKEAEDKKNLYGRKTILFVDEVHRWNKSQQDALLPWVENGTIILIGATTENPFFEVNKALVSRSRVFQLKPLEKEDLFHAATQALSDKDRGYGKWKVVFEEGALEHLVETANGDCRSLLNALELAVETTPETWPPMAGTEIYISKEACEESIQKKVVLYDRDGDYHYDIISAFIKSLRGRDPDAACYWLARMVKAGEDPHFIFRRMLISSCEDTGLADPRAISIVESCAAAFDRVGFPEGNYFLAHAALYLATAPKSNSSMAFFDAMTAVEKEDVEVPNHLRDNNRDAEGFGHGKGYLYPHAYRDHWVAQQYLPDSLTGRVFYTPTEQGYEGEIRGDVLSRREAQIAAILEDADSTEGLMVNPISDWWAKSGHFAGFIKTEENLTFAPEDTNRTNTLNKAENAWKARTELNRAEVLLNTRNAMITSAEILRHHRCLVVNADDGLLVFDLIRKTPEGHVYGICRSQKGLETLQQYSSTLSELDKPEYIVQEGTNLWRDDCLLKAASSFGDMEYDRFFARNIFAGKEDLKTAAGIFNQLKGKKILAPEFRVVLSQIIPSGGQLLSRLAADFHGKEKELLARIEKIEKEFYGDSTNPFFDWDETTIEEIFKSAGFECKAVPFLQTEKRRIGPEECSKWFDTEKSAYGKFIAAKAGKEDFEKFRDLFMEAAQKTTFDWKVKNCIIAIG